MESTKPETLARTSTVSTAAKRPVYSSHSVMSLCTGRATVTDGAAGAALAAGVLSQPASDDTVMNRQSSRIARTIALPSLHIPNPSLKAAFNEDQSLTKSSQINLWPLREPAAEFFVAISDQG